MTRRRSNRRCGKGKSPAPGSMSGARSRRRADARRARWQTGNANSQSAGLAGLRQALRARVRIYAASLRVIPGRGRKPREPEIHTHRQQGFRTNRDYGFRTTPELVIGPATSGWIRWRFPEWRLGKRLARDPRSRRKLFHALRDDVGQLHHLLTELRIFGNLALNAIAVEAQLSAQRLQVADQVVALARRCVRHPP